MSTASPITKRSSLFTGNASHEELTHWRGIAERVAETLATDAVARDRANTAPVAQLELLREAGLANLLVPPALGGNGAHWETAFAVARVIARVDASVAQLLGYHYLNQACVVFYGPDELRQEEWLRRSAEGQWFWSDSFNPVSPDLSFVADGDNYRLSGLKRFATGAAVADVIIAGAVAEGGALDGELVVFALDGSRAGIEHLDDWDNVGYRASASGSVRYTDVVVTPRRRHRRR